MGFKSPAQRSYFPYRGRKRPDIQRMSVHGGRDQFGGRKPCGGGLRLFNELQVLEDRPGGAGPGRVQVDGQQQGRIGRVHHAVGNYLGAPVFKFSRRRDIRQEFFMRALNAQQAVVDRRRAVKRKNNIGRFKGQQPFHFSGSKRQAVGVHAPAEAPPGGISQYFKYILPQERPPAAEVETRPGGETAHESFYFSPTQLREPPVKAARLPKVAKGAGRVAAPGEFHHHGFRHKSRAAFSAPRNQEGFTRFEIFSGLDR